MPVHHWLRPSGLPSAGRSLWDGQAGDLPVPMQEVSSACQGLRPRGTSRALAITHPSVLPSASLTASASRTTKLSRLNTWPTDAPVTASSLASRPTTHDSGPMWFALPFIVKDLHPLLLPVSRRWPGWSEQRFGSDRWVPEPILSID